MRFLGQRFTGLFGLIFLSSLLMVHSASAGRLVLESIGARYGMGANSSSRDFMQAEAVATWDWGNPWGLGDHYFLQPRLDLSAGWLGEKSQNSGLLTLGPALALERRDFPVSLEAGVSPSFLTRSHFAAKDVGSPFQFSNYLGLSCELTRFVKVSYRFLHMSNGGVASPNPGLNMHLIGISYVF